MDDSGRQLVFGAFRLDPAKQQLWQGEASIPIQPRPLAVLQYLAEHPGQTISKEELLKEVWEGTYVTKAALKVCIQEIRKALGETAASPQYIETIGREGYRFGGDSVEQAAPAGHATTAAGQSLVVGREAEVDRLHQQLRKALDGERQLVFVTGEAGLGKTTIVDRFQAQVQAEGRVTIGRGQCVEQYGEGEAYLPILEALGRLCREAGGGQIASLLRQYAPLWLGQLPGVIEEAERQSLVHEHDGTQQRMLREMAEALVAGTARRPLVLILEDLHWSDPSTLELLAYLARRTERARLLIVGTYRPVDVVLSQHPLQGVKQELQAKQLCEELSVGMLTQQDVREYLAVRFSDHTLAEIAAEPIYRRTDGNALFMVSVVNDLIDQHVIAQQNGSWSLRASVETAGTPDSLQQLIQKQAGRLSPEQQRVLAAASVAGQEFIVATVAAGLGLSIDEVEECCEELAWQGQFLQETGYRSGRTERSVDATSFSTRSSTMCSTIRSRKRVKRACIDVSENV